MYNGGGSHDGEARKYQCSPGGQHDRARLFVERRGQSADCVARSQEQDGNAKIERRSVHGGRDGLGCRSGRSRFSVLGAVVEKMTDQLKCDAVVVDS